jgi:hypothetical protein
MLHETLPAFDSLRIHKSRIQGPSVLLPPESLDPVARKGVEYTVVSCVDQNKDRKGWTPGLTAIVWRSQFTRQCLCDVSCRKHAWAGKMVLGIRNSWSAVQIYAAKSDKR